ncbi:hypothetical protein SNEBB_002226 [Seison nebaliae]|nr:hypothetical protein SNEBB_002226 [Seison nebaliae]
MFFKLILFVYSFLVVSCASESAAVTTTVASSNAKECVFPFLYNHKCYMECTDDFNAGQKFCGMTPFIRDRKHVRPCTDSDVGQIPKIVEGCVFPFIYNNECRNDCVDEGNSSWCSSQPKYNDKSDRILCNGDILWQFNPFLILLGLIIFVKL